MVWNDGLGCAMLLSYEDAREPILANPIGIDKDKMPPHPADKISDEDLKAAVGWILALE
jgi:hypothetical protein